MSDVNPILDNPLVLSMLFHPRKVSAGSSRFPGARDGTVVVDDEVAVGWRLFPTGDETDPAMLYFHGNGELAADYDEVARLYAERNIHLLVADYRGYGWSNGQPKASTMLPDARKVAAAFPRLLHEAGLKPRALFVMGRSLGSPCAIDVVAQDESRWKGLIIESGFARTFGLLGRLGMQLPGVERLDDGINNLEKIARFRLPTLVIHGEIDRLIPASEGIALHDACGSPDKRLLLIPNGGHNDVMFVGLKAYMQAIVDLIAAAG